MQAWKDACAPGQSGRKVSAPLPNQGGTRHQEQAPGAGSSAHCGSTHHALQDRTAAKPQLLGQDLQRTVHHAQVVAKAQGTWAGAQAKLGCIRCCGMPLGERQATVRGLFQAWPSRHVADRASGLQVNSSRPSPMLATDTQSSTAGERAALLAPAAWCADGPALGPSAAAAPGTNTSLKLPPVRCFRLPIGLLPGEVNKGTRSPSWSRRLRPGLEPPAAGVPPMRLAQAKALLTGLPEERCRKGDVLTAVRPAKAPILAELFIGLPRLCCDVAR